MTGKVAIISGGSRGVGAGLVAGYRRQGWAVVASARTIKPSGDPDLLTVAGDITDPETADRVIGGALGRFGRIDTLVNNAGVFISKPFTDYTAADYALAVGASLTGFFWLTQRAPGWSIMSPMRPRPTATSTSGAITGACRSRPRPGRYRSRGYQLRRSCAIALTAA